MPIVKYKNRRLDSAHLDQGESMFFLRQLEAIDQQAYQIQYPGLMARQLIPTQAGVPSWAHSYTYRQFDKKGIASLIASSSEDIPLVETNATGEFTSLIKPFGAAYKYDLDEIAAAAATNTSLEADRAATARWACERQVDQVLALGTYATPASAASGTGAPTMTGMLGLLNQTGTTSFTLGTKVAGGTTWGSLSAPNATGDEIAGDLMGLCNNLFETTSQLWSSFRILMNPKQFDYASMKRLGSVSDTTALAFAKANCPYIENVYPWWQIPAGTIVAFAPDPLVAAAIVPMEWQPEAPQARNLAYVVNTRIRCGGVVSKYPVAISYATGA